MKRNITVRTIAFTLDGYENYEMNTYRKVNAWIIGNIMFGGVIGLGIDALTGAMYRIKPEYIEVELKKKETK
jgi:hypothetical protein